MEQVDKYLKPIGVFMLGVVALIAFVAGMAYFLVLIINVPERELSQDGVVILAFPALVAFAISALSVLRYIHNIW